MTSVNRVGLKEKTMPFSRSLNERAQAADPALYFDSLQNFFTHSSLLSRPAPKDYRIGGRRVRLQFLSPRLEAQMAPALAAQTAPETDDTPEMTVTLMDSSVQARPLPLPHWGNDFMPAFGLLPDYNHSGYHFSVNCDLRLLQGFNTHTRQGFFWVENAADLPSYERAHPLRMIFHWWAASSGLSLIHAAALGFRDSGVLLTGRGGAGKSTAALACINGGLECCGDDLAVIDPDAPVPLAHGLYNILKIKSRLHALRYFENLLPCFEPVNLQGELWLNFHQSMPAQTKRSLALRALVCLKQNPAQMTRLTPLGKSEALQSLLPGTLEILPGGWKHTFQAMSRLVRKLDTYQLTTGPDVENIPHVLQELLQKHAYV